MRNRGIIRETASQATLQNAEHAKVQGQSKATSPSQILLVTYAVQNALLETQGTLNKNPDCLAEQRVSSGIMRAYEGRFGFSPERWIF